MPDLGAHHDIFAARLLILVVDHKHVKFAHVSDPAPPWIQRVSVPIIRWTRNSRAKFPLITLRSTRFASMHVGQQLRRLNRSAGAPRIGAAPAGVPPPAALPGSS